VRGREFAAYYLDNLAVRTADSGKSSLAERLFRRALDVDPDAARILYNYGTFLAGTGRDADAVTFLGRAIAAGWDDSRVFVNRGVVNWRLGNGRAAREDFVRALGLDPGNREALTNLRLLAGDEQLDPVNPRNDL
jgi:Tfp pilus assembly protein PilF